MKIARVVLAGLVGLVGLVTLIGALAPRSYRASRSARFQAPPDSVWATLTDFSNLPSWAPEVRRVERLPDHNGNPVWLHDGRRWSGPMEVVEFAPPYRFTMKISDRKLPFGGGWTYEVMSSDGETLVTITEAAEIKGPILRFLVHYVFGYTSTMDSYLKALGRKFDEDVVPATPSLGSTAGGTES